MDFTNIPQRWDNEGVKPTDTLANEGFKAGYRPPAAYFNYLFNNYCKCIEELQGAVKTVESNIPDGQGVTYEQITIPTDAWKPSGKYQTYKLTREGANLVNVNFNKESLPDAITAGVLSVTETTDGVCTIFAEKVPESVLTATIEIIKGDSK